MREKMGLLYSFIVDLLFSKMTKCPHCQKEQKISVHESSLYVKCEYCGKLIPLVKEPKINGDDDYD